MTKKVKVRKLTYGDLTTRWKKYFPCLELLNARPGPIPCSLTVWYRWKDLYPTNAVVTEQVFQYDAKFKTFIPIDTERRFKMNNKTARFRPTDEEPRMRWRVILHNRPFVPKEYVVSINNACRWEGVQAVIRWFPEFLEYIQPIPYASINGMMRLDKLTADSYRLLALRRNIKHA